MINIIDKCAIGFWKQNKFKFVSVIVCMLLSVSLLMSLFITLNVFFNSQVLSKKNIYGDYMVHISDINQNDITNICSNNKINNSFSSYSVGFANYSISAPYKKYIYVMSADVGFMKNMPINLINGRLPENENELLLPSYLGVNLQLNDNIVLDLGNRTTKTGTVQNFLPYQEGEYIVDSILHSYQIVGFYEKAIFEDSLFPACIAITNCDINTNMNAELYFSLDNPYHLNSILNTLENYSYSTNDELLACYGINLNYKQLDIAQLFLILVVILIAIVIVMLFILNKNIINISFGEKRKKLYYRLYQLGALKKQFYLSALKETIVFAIITIPFSEIIGIIGSNFTINILTEITSLQITKNKYNIILMIIPILIISIFISVSHFLYIKHTIQEKKKQVISKKNYIPLTTNYTIKNICKKYILDNKKQTSSMITTITICLVMFISFSCICDNIKKANENFESTIESDIEFDYYDYHMNYIDVIELYNQMKSVDGVISSNCVFSIKDGTAKINDINYSSQIYVVDDDYFSVIFPDSTIIIIDSTHVIDSAEISGQFIFTKSISVGNNDPFAENQKIKTEEKTFSIDFLASVETESQKYMGLNLNDYSITLIYPYSAIKDFLIECNGMRTAHLFFNSSKADKSYKEISNFFNDNGYSSYYLINYQSLLQEERNNYYLIRFFSTIFTLFIFIISIFNLLNITLNNIKNRISDYIVLYSLGMQKENIQKMNLYENIFYQIKGIVISIIPITIITILGYIYIKNGKNISIYIPIREILIVFLVFTIIDIITVILSIHFLEKDKIIGYLKEKNL